MWFERIHVKKHLQQTIATRPAILLTGARQTGKSSLLQRTFPDAAQASFDHLNLVLEAKERPDSFLDRFPDQTILDEIQYVPGLFRELKIRIDQERNLYGKWILTGSRQFELMENVSESLAGRIGILHLETLSAEELRTAGVDAADYPWKGGYPELWATPDINTRDFFESYIKTYIERDLKTLIEIRNLTDFRRFFRILALRIGQLVNYRDMAADTGVSDVTVKKWLHALEAGGLVYLLPPFHANIGKRLVKSPKLYFADHGLGCHLLGINSRDNWQDHPHKGNLWENLVLMELVKTRGLTPGRELFFYRDQNGVEIDCIIQTPATLTLLEAKYGERAANAKTNFRKVLPLLSGKYSTRTALAMNIPEAEPLHTGEFACYNPLKTGYPWP